MMSGKCFVVFLLLGMQLLDGSEAALYRLRPGVSPPLRARRLQHRSAMYYQPDMMYIPGMTFTARDTFTGYIDPVANDTPCTSCRIPEPEPEPEPQPQPEPEPEQQPEVLPEPQPELPLEPSPLPDLEETTRVHKTEMHFPPGEDVGASSVTQIPIFEESTTQRTRTRVQTRPPPPLPEEEEEDDDDWPIPSFNGRKGVPHNVFFPMMFGYSGHGRSGHDGSGYPGVTAIANAFSSGKGGVATSHATAFGNAPPLNKHWKRSQHNN